MLSKQICRIFFSFYFAELNGPITHPLLYPEALGVYMPQFAQSLSPTYAYGGRAVGLHSDRHSEAQVFEKGLIPKRYSAGLDHAVKLGFS